MRPAIWYIALVLAVSPACVLAQTVDFPPLPVYTVEPGFDYPSPFPELTPPTPIASSPNQISPTPIAPSEPPTDYIPAPAPPFAPLPEGDVVNVSGENVRTTFDNGRAQYTIARGNVCVRHRNITVTADCGDIDYISGIATFRGNVVFQVDTQQVHSQIATLNIRTGAWNTNAATSTIEPSFTRGYLVAPVFADAGAIQGVRQKSMGIKNGEVTTCNLEHPHYMLVSKSVDVYPGVRIVLRNVSFYALDKRLVSFRKLVIPLRQVMRDPQLVPKIGQTAEEGFYAKFSYPLSGSRKEASLLLLDLMSKKGVGTGLRSNYQFGTATGETQFYTLNDRNLGRQTYSGWLSHNQLWGDVKFNFTSDFRANEYQYAPQSQTLNSRATFTRNTTNTDSSLIIGYQSNDTYTKTSSTTGNLSFTQRFGDTSEFQSLFDYIAYSGTNNTARLSSNLTFTQKTDKYDWAITATELTDLSDEAFVGYGQFGGIEKLPELSLTSDNARLGKTLPFGLPMQMRLSFGEFSEVSTDYTTLRTFLDLNTPAKTRALSNTWSLISGGGFKQYVYGNDSAQYVYNVSAQLNKRFTEESEFSLTYRFQKPNGYTPFRTDYISDYNIINAALNLKQKNKFKLSLLTGYNFEQTSLPWQNATIRFTVQPTKSFLFYTSTAFNINTWRWKTLINQVRIRSGEDKFRLDLGTRYDTTLGQLSSIRGLLDTKINSKTHVQALAGYNGITGDFEYQNLKITRDLHCWELSLTFVNQTGFYEDKGIRLNLRIKAFPLYESFGQGVYGQVLDTSVGEIY